MKPSRIELLKKKLRNAPGASHQLGWLAYDVCELRDQLLPEDRATFETLVAKFRQSLSGELMGMVTALLKYAIRLAESDGELLYEEMHKLYSLRDEIQCLSDLGAVDGGTLDRVDKAVRERIRSQPSEAAIAARQCIKSWKQDWWWYSEVL